MSYLLRPLYGSGCVPGCLNELGWAQTQEAQAQVTPTGRLGRPAALFAPAQGLGVQVSIDPELLIIGGGSSPSADVFLPRFSRTLADLCPSVPEIAASELGSESVALGGLSLGRRHLQATLTERVRSDESFPTPTRACELLRDRTAVATE
jgi:hypothetical protein